MNAGVRYIDYDIPHREIHSVGAILNLPDTDGWIPYQSEIIGSHVKGNIILRVWMRKQEVFSMAAA